MKKITIIIVLIAITFSIVAYYFYNNSNHNSNQLTLYGNVDIRQVDLGFRVYGRIKNVYVDEGDVVKPGMLVADLEKKPYIDSLMQAKGDLSSAKASYENALVLFNRRKELISKNAISQENYDDALSNKNIKEAMYQSALGNLATAQTNLEDTKVFAPTDGWVLTRIREPGSVVNVGEPVLTVSIKSPVWVRAYVNEPNLGRIHFGMKGKVKTDTPDGKVYEGHIGFISPVAEFTPKTVETTQLRTDLVYRLRLIIDNPDEGLKQGMPVTVKLFTGDR